MLLFGKPFTLLRWLHNGDLQWWGSLTMVRNGNKAKHLSLVNHTTKTIHHHHLSLILNLLLLLFPQPTNSPCQCPAFKKMFHCGRVHMKVIFYQAQSGIIAVRTKQFTHVLSNYWHYRSTISINSITVAAFMNWISGNCDKKTKKDKWEKDKWLEWLAAVHQSWMVRWSPRILEFWQNNNKKNIGNI